MAEPGERQRTVLRAPRVEFDLSALVLGAVGYLAYQWTWPALAWLLAVPGSGPAAGWQGLRFEFWRRVLGATGLPFVGYIQQLVGGPGAIVVPATEKGTNPTLYNLDQQVWHALPHWQIAVVAAWLLLLWSVIGGAIARVYAVRIARDESIGASDAAGFSIAELPRFVAAPLFVIAAGALFFVLAALCTFLCGLPYAGPLLSLVFYPLAILLALVVTVIAIGGVFGFPMIHCALATERNGTLDAISRTFSYVFTRPVAFLTSLVLISVVAMVIQGFGAAVLGTLARALEAGLVWNPAGSGPDFRSEGAGAMKVGFDQGIQGGLLTVPPLAGADVLTGAWRVIAWIFTSLAALAVNGYVLAYFVGGLTDTYFLLRSDVDGIEDTEVYVEGAEASLSDPLPGEPAAPAGKP